MKEKALAEELPGTDLIESYLQHRLTPEQEEAFEEQLLENPALALAVEDAQRLRGGLQGLAAEEGARSLSRPAVPARSLARSALPLAAALLLALALVFLWQGERRIASLEAELAAARNPAAQTTFLSLSRQRGGGEEGGPLLELGAPTEVFVFSFELGERNAESYDVEVRGPGEGALWTFESLHADAAGRLVISLPARLLAPGVLKFLVLGRQAGQPPKPVGRFTLRVAAPDGGPPSP